MNPSAELMTLNALVVDDEPHICSTLSRLLHRYQISTVEAENGKVALEKLSQQSIDFVITDVKMPVMDGIEFVKKLRQDHTEIPIVVMSGHGGEDIIIDALRAGANNFFKKPTDLYVIKNVLLPIISLVKEKRSRYFHPQLLTRAACEIEMENDLALVPGIVGYLLRGLIPKTYPKDLNAVELTLYELISNAIEHGNLEIGGKEREEAQRENKLQDLVMQKLSIPELAQRRVHIKFEYQDHRIKVVIADQGKGFDWKNIFGNSAKDDLLAECGRGIFIARMVCKEITYNELGNQVTVNFEFGQEPKEAGA